MTPLVLVLGALAAQPVLDLPDDVAPVVDTTTTATTTATATTTTAPSVAAAALGLVDGVHDVELMKGLQQARLRAGHTVLGGYGQLNARGLSSGRGPDGEDIGPFALTATVRRLVVFIAHTFDDDLRFYGELEWENAIACRTCNGSVEIEQAFIEWDLRKEAERASALTLRAGLVIVPIGILNQWHEPPVFHGVERARLEESLIPSTWRELGVGVTGELRAGLRYEAYVTTGLDPLAFDKNGFARGRQNGGLVNTGSVMLSARVELEPLLGAIVGVSAVAGETGGLPFTMPRYATTTGQPVQLTLPLFFGEADARVRRDGLEARALVVVAAYPNAGDLMQARRVDGSATLLLDDTIEGTPGAVPTLMRGAQLEVAYDVLRWFTSTEQQVLPFARVEFVDLQAAVPDGFVPDRAQNTKELTVGLGYRPIRAVVFKLDGQLRNRDAGPDDTQVNLGMGLMF
jgi:hypothetical protein